MDHPSSLEDRCKSIVICIIRVHGQEEWIQLYSHGHKGLNQQSTNAVSCCDDTFHALFGQPTADLPTSASTQELACVSQQELASTLSVAQSYSNSGRRSVL